MSNRVTHEWRSVNDLPLARIKEFTAANLITVWNLISGRFLILPPTQMKYELLRILSLMRYPREHKPDITRIAAAGFYSDGSEDGIICYKCGLTLYNLTEGDDPLFLHLTLSSDCDFLKQNKDFNIRCFQGTTFENDLFRNPVYEELQLANVINIARTSTEVFLEHDLASGEEIIDPSNEIGIPYDNEHDNDNAALLPDPFRFQDRNSPGNEEEVNHESINGILDGASDLNASLFYRVDRPMNDLRETAEVVSSVNQISQPQMGFQMVLRSTDADRPNSEYSRVDGFISESLPFRAISVSAQGRNNRKHSKNIERNYSTDEARPKCRVCKENFITNAFYVCGHTVCRTCADAVDVCPACGREVNGSLDLQFF